jgi:hypothetical protein
MASFRCHPRQPSDGAERSMYGSTPTGMDRDTTAKQQAAPQSPSPAPKQPQGVPNNATNLARARAGAPTTTASGGAGAPRVLVARRLSARCRLCRRQVRSMWLRRPLLLLLLLLAHAAPYGSLPTGRDDAYERQKKSFLIYFSFFFASRSRSFSCSHAVLSLFFFFFFSSFYFIPADDAPMRAGMFATAICADWRCWIRDNSNGRRSCRRTTRQQRQLRQCAREAGRFVCAATIQCCACWQAAVLWLWRFARSGARWRGGGGGGQQQERR